MTDEQIDWCYWLRFFDPDNCETDTRKWIPDRSIPWIIDHYQLDKHDSTIFNIRWNWKHKNYSDKQRWMIMCEANKRELQLFT